MPIIRNPFSKRPGVSNGLDPFPDENNKAGVSNGTGPGFEKVDTVGKSSAMSINSGKSQEPDEYKMSGKAPVPISPASMQPYRIRVLVPAPHHRIIMLINAFWN